MKTETRMDYLLQRLADMNDLLDLRQEENETSAGRSKKKSGGKSDGKQGGSHGGLFGSVQSEMFFSRNGSRRPGVVGIIHPSDGHPQQEHCPDFNWFRPLTYNNATWILYWPELTI